MVRGLDAANAAFRVGVKSLLVVYILVTSAVSTAPVKPFVESPLFVGAYVLATLVIAQYDAVAALLLVSLLSIWIVREGHAQLDSVREHVVRELLQQQQPGTPAALAPAHHPAERSAPAAAAAGPQQQGHRRSAGAPAVEPPVGFEATRPSEFEAVRPLY